MAQWRRVEPVSINSISARQGISERYLEQLMALLKKAGLVKSIRGAGGVYVLAKEKEDIAGRWFAALEAKAGTCRMPRLYGNKVVSKWWPRNETCLHENQ